ncbi:MAG: hypothetical protein HYW95_01575 [Candidatus Wildermuthbacteria bacterium]|nr:hypothetical protein [Candidatus Wildermuthbacteria bacterium]
MSQQLSFVNSWADSLVLLVIALWTLPWKGIALWKAAHREEKIWFIAILILNTFAILEILYIFVFSKGKFAIFKKQEVK